MSLERLRHECERCGAKFMTELALRGHRSVHLSEDIGSDRP